MKTLYLAWQTPTEATPSRAWFPIGRLDANVTQPTYRFRYTRGALKAGEEAGFKPLLAFPELKKDYRSDTLFPLFQNRVLSPKRKDFAEYLSWLDLDAEHADPIEILGVSGGERETDNLEVFPRMRKDEEGNFRVRFFLHGLRHLGAVAQERVERLAVGDPLRVSIELNNPATRLAVTLLTDDYVMIGWAPRYLVDDLVASVPHAPHLTAQIAHLNDAQSPLNKRVLIDYAGRVPDAWEPMSTPDFEPLR
jgi:hypothetical protein